MADLFKDKIVPIMDRIKGEYDEKRRDELRHALHKPNLYMDPTGGVGAEMAAMSTLKHTGEWSSKTVEDYIEDVKSEIKKSGITVTPEIEKEMIDKMVADSIPKSSIEYIMSKAAENSIFMVGDITPDSPLKQEINKKAEKAYDPKYYEKVAGWAAGSAVDMVATAGLGGGLGAATSFVATDVVINAAIDAGEHVIEKVEEKRKSKEEKRGKEDNKNENALQDIPSIVIPEHRDDWLADQQQGNKVSLSAEDINSNSETQSPESRWQDQQFNPSPSVQEGHDETKSESELQNTIAPETPYAAPSNDNRTGWSGFWQSFGLDNLGDMLSHPGRLFSTLPDMIIGLFTGKNIPAVRQNIIPLTTLLAATLMSKKRYGPLKSLLFITSALALLNKTSQAANSQTEAPRLQAEAVPQNKYRMYAEEPLDSRITDPKLNGNRYVANFDGTPVAVTLPDHIIEAHQQGALPLSTLSNHLLAQSDRQQQLIQQNYEEGQQETYTRTLNQR